MASVICHQFPSEEREIQSLFSDAKSFCSFRIYICMLNKDIGCVVPVFFPLIWLENKGHKPVNVKRDQNTLWVIFGVS